MSSSSSISNTSKCTHSEIIVEMTKDEYNKPIEDEYAKKVSEMSYEEIYDNYNPGATNSDGSVNFECHCVAHLVGSPCGYQAREAISCQRNAGNEGMENGACAKEFMSFIECTVNTKCFRMTDDVDAKKNP